MKKYKAYLTMEFTADVEAINEDEAREALRRAVSIDDVCGYCNGTEYSVENVKIVRYWGGGNEILKDGTVVVR